MISKFIKSLSKRNRLYVMNEFECNSVMSCSFCMPADLIGKSEFHRPVKLVIGEDGKPVYRCSFRDPNHHLDKERLCNTLQELNRDLVYVEDDRVYCDGIVLDPSFDYGCGYVDTDHIELDEDFVRKLREEGFS